MIPNNKTAGTLSIIYNDDQHRRLSDLIDAAATLIKADDQSYRYSICTADENTVSEAEVIFLKKAGKKRASRHVIKSVFDTVQSFQHAKTPLTLRTRRVLKDHLAESANEQQRLDLRKLDLDNLVANNPADPLSQAYLAGLSSLGLAHPYAQLNDTVLPASLTHLFVHDIDLLCRAVQCFILAQLSAGLSIYVSCENYNAFLANLPDFSINPTFQQREIRVDRHQNVPADFINFDSINDEREAIALQISQSRPDVVICLSVRSRQAIEAHCLFAGYKYRVEPAVSLKNSIEIRALIAYLDWATQKTEDGLFTLLSLQGSSKARFSRFSKANGLSSKVTSASVSVKKAGTKSDIYNHLLALSQLIMTSSFELSEVENIVAFLDWASHNIPRINQHRLSLFKHHLSGSIRAEKNPMTTLRDRLLSTAINSDHTATKITTLTDRHLQLAKNAWLSLEECMFEDLHRFPALVEPYITEHLSVSYQNKLRDHI